MAEREILEIVATGVRSPHDDRIRNRYKGSLHVLCKSPGTGYRDTGDILDCLAEKT